MSGNFLVTASNSVTVRATDTQAPGRPAHDLTFGEVLSDLNPLQYLPVIGTIYRSITGDSIPKPLREAGSLVVSGLMGGPVGLVTNLSVLALEKLTGIDLEDLEHGMLARVGLGPTPDAGVVAAAPAYDEHPADADGATAPFQRTESGPWSVSQLAAYGVTTLKNGDFQRDGLVGADVLNDLQLRRTAPGAVAAANGTWQNS